MSSITELITTIANNEIAVYEAGINAAKTKFYSTPTQVGVWIDSTPIWRVGFEATIAANGEVNVAVQFKDTDSSNVRILDCECFSTTTTPNANTTHHRKSDMSFEANGTINITYTNDTEETLLYGWLEYIAPEIVSE